MVSYVMAVQGARSLTIEPNDPLFNHPSDYLSQILIANVLNDEGFDYWKRTFFNALSSKNKVGFIDGSIDQPANDSPLLPY